MAKKPAPEAGADTETTGAAPETTGAAGGYVVAWHIKTGGKRYAPGDAIDLDDEAAVPFLQSGAIRAKGE